MRIISAVLVRRNRRLAYALAGIFAVTGGGFLGAVGINAMNESLSRWTTEFGEIVPEMAASGLVMADAYVGQLIGFPNHFSCGISFNPMLAGGKEIPIMSGLLFPAPLNDFYREKYLFPVYTVDGRLGGLANLPVDFGVKLGFLPSIPFWDAADFAYFLTGVDMRIRIYYAPVVQTLVSLGISYNYMEGKVSGTTAAGGDITGADLTGRLLWETTLLTLRLHISQPLVRTFISFFGGIEAGYAITEVGWGVEGSGGITVTNLTAASSYGGRYTLSPDDFEVRMFADSVFVEASNGLSFEFGHLRIDFSVYANIITLSIGGRMAVRFQQ